MNIWATKKDISIKHLLFLLTDQFQEDSFEVIDSAMDDKRSVRLANSMVTDIQIYVFTYGQQEGCYGVHIEYPSLQETSYSDTIEIHENISYNTLVNIMLTNLDIPQIKINSRDY